MLAHQKLKVYGKALAVVASLTNHSAGWDKRHSVVDQLCRASESVVLNLAEGVRVCKIGAGGGASRAWDESFKPRRFDAAGSVRMLFRVNSR